VLVVGVIADVGDPPVHETLGPGFSDEAFGEDPLEHPREQR
jgi:hypothetical protein